jgi:hypothetical protein
MVPAHVEMALDLLAAESLKPVLKKRWQEYGMTAALTFAATSTVAAIAVLAYWLAAAPTITQFLGLLSKECD